MDKESILNKENTITALSAATGGIAGAGVFTGLAFVVAPYAAAPLFLGGLIIGSTSCGALAKRLQHKKNESKQVSDLKETDKLKINREEKIG